MFKILNNVNVNVAVYDPMKNLSMTSLIKYIIIIAHLQRLTDTVNGFIELFGFYAHDF